MVSNHYKLLSTISTIFNIINKELEWSDTIFSVTVTLNVNNSVDDESGVEMEQDANQAQDAKVKIVMFRKMNRLHRHWYMI